MIRRTLTQTKNTLNEKEESIIKLYKEDLKEIYSTILFTDSNNFLNNLSKRAKISISKQFNDISLETIAKIDNIIQNQVYPLEYKAAYTAISLIKKKQDGPKQLKPFIGDYLSHNCNRNDKLIHSCGKPFYTYKCKIEAKDSLVFLAVCINCDMTYKGDLVKAYCTNCKEEYYTKIIDDADKKDKKIPKATWKQYHCPTVIDEIMKCNECRNDLYYIEERESVKCEKCKVEKDPKRLTNQCVKCNKSFIGDAKAYNHYDNIKVKINIKDALVKKMKARPEHMNCCKDLEIKKTRFTHNQSCNGELYLGEMSKRKIVVCSKCESYDYYDTFKWSCPKCISNNYLSPQKKQEKQKEERETAPIDDPRKSIPYCNSEARRIPFIPIQVNKKNSSNSSLVRIMHFEGNIPNYSALKCKLAKRFSLHDMSDIMNFDERMKDLNEEKPKKVKTSSLLSNSTCCSNNQWINESCDEAAFCKFDINDYTIIKQIGEGTFGKIFLVESKTHQQFAMKKIIASTEKEMDSLKQEYEILMSLQKTTNAPSLIRIHGVQSNQLDKTTYIMYVLMELASTDWEKEITTRNTQHKYYSEGELVKIMSSLIQTFAQIQRNNISHRDIKPQNILLCSNGHYKIADFGEAKEFEDKNKKIELQTLRGTELYMSPILFQALRNKKTSRSKYLKHNAFKSDVFSFGLCVLYAASLSFNALYDIRELIDMISIKVVVYKYLKKLYSEKMIELILSMIEIDENYRSDFITLERKFEQMYYGR